MTGNILEQAKQGNPNAIAALMSRSMKSQGIDVKASLDDRCLEVILEADKVPTPQATVSFIRKGMTNLGVKSIDTVRVSAYQVGEPTPAWQEDIFLYDTSSSPPSPTMPSPSVELDETEALLDHEDLLSENLLGDDLSSQGYDSMHDANFYHDDYVRDLPEEVTEFTPDDEYSTTNYDSEEDVMEDEERMEMDMEEEASAPKKKSSVLPLLLLLLAALGLGGFYLYSQKPELLAGIPVLKDLVSPSSSPETSTATAPEGSQTATSGTAATEAENAPDAAASGTAAMEAEKVPDAATSGTAATEAQPPAETPQGETTAPSAPAAPSNDPFPEAVRKATSAAQLTQTATTSEEWNLVVGDWQGAIELMQAVPESHPKYSVAQDRVTVYQKNLEYAQKRAGQ